MVLNQSTKPNSHDTPMFDLQDIEKRLLIVSPNAANKARLKELFSEKYDCKEADSAEGVLGMLRKVDFSVIVSDVQLPALSGIAMIPYVQMLSPNTVVILLSSENSADLAIKAFRTGAFDYLQKPCSSEQLSGLVDKAMEHYELKCLKDRYSYHLEELVAERTIEADKALEEAENSYRTTLKALVQALETRDLETHGHSERVVTFSLRLGHELGLSKPELRALELGALLHDIGKIGVPDSILRKPAKLTEEEWEKMKLHPLHGEKILRNIKYLEGAARVVSQHHEKWDGTGYPYGLAGNEIVIGARIFSVVDAYDAMVSDRVYRLGRPYEAALEELVRCSGTQFDPQVVAAFRNVPREDWEILRQRSLTDKQEVLSFQTIVSDLVYSRPSRVELVH